MAMTLRELHDVIQDVMGWQDYHLWEFRSGEESIVPDPSRDALPGRPKPRGASQVQLSSVLDEARPHLGYLYDFGDDWRVHVWLEEPVAAVEGRRYPYLVGGERSGPPEDFGGIWSYEEACDGLRSGEGGQRLLDWMGPDFDPDTFSLKPGPLRGARAFEGEGAVDLDLDAWAQQVFEQAKGPMSPRAVEILGERPRDEVDALVARTLADEGAGEAEVSNAAQLVVALGLQGHEDALLAALGRAEIDETEEMLSPAHAVLFDALRATPGGAQKALAELSADAHWPLRTQIYFYALYYRVEMEAVVEAMAEDLSAATGPLRKLPDLIREWLGEPEPALVEPLERHLALIRESLPDLEALRGDEGAALDEDAVVYPLRVLDALETVRGGAQGDEAELVEVLEELLYGSLKDVTVLQPEEWKRAVARREPAVAPERPGRNDPCWCGSGKKYKKCHLRQDEG